MIESISGMGGGMMGMMGMRGAQGRPGPEQAFNKIDANGDGALDAAELQIMSDMMADKMGENAPSAEDLMAALDGDGDGALSFAEFQAGRPEGRGQGGSSSGRMGSNSSFQTMNQMDLSSLFAESESDSETEDESIYSYA